MIELRIGSLCVVALLALACSGEQGTAEQPAQPTPESQNTAAPPPDAGTPPSSIAEKPPAQASPAPPVRTGETPPRTPPPAARVVTEEELQPLRNAVSRDLDDVDAQRNLALLLWEGGRYDRALNHFERAVQIDANNPRSLRDLGRAYEQLGRPSDAEGAYRRMATVPGAYHVALYELGRLAMERGDLETAMRFFKQSIESKPDYMRALYSLGVAFEQAGRFREAYESYARVVQQEPPEEARAVLDYLDALFRMGKLDLKMGAVERAAAILAEVVEAFPEHPEAHYEYGRALQALGREEEAKREFTTHVRLLEDVTTSEGAHP